MTESAPLPQKLPGKRRPSVRSRGLTLVEIMISIAVLAVGMMGGVSAFLLLNRYAANLRNISEARALCQERIEQALTLHFTPIGTGTMGLAVPLAPCADPSIGLNTTMAILGVASTTGATNYNTTSGAFTGGSNLVTSTENIPIYTQSDGTSANNSANVPFTRTTTVSAASNMTALNLVVFTVTVSYVFHGQTYSTSMSTLRGPD